MTNVKSRVVSMVVRRRGVFMFRGVWELKGMKGMSDDTHDILSWGNLGEQSLTQSCRDKVMHTNWGKS